MARVYAANVQGKPVRSRRRTGDRAIPARLYGARDHLVMWGRRVASPNSLPQETPPHEMGSISIDGQYSASESPFKKPSVSESKSRRGGRGSKITRQSSPKLLCPTPLRPHQINKVPLARPGPSDRIPSPISDASLGLQEVSNFGPSFLDYSWQAASYSACDATDYPYEQSIYQGNWDQPPPSIPLECSIFSASVGYGYETVQSRTVDPFPLYIGPPGVQSTPTYSFDSYALNGAMGSETAQAYTHNLFLGQQYSSPTPSTPSSLCSNYSSGSSAQDFYQTLYPSQVVGAIQYPYNPSLPST